MATISKSSRKYLVSFIAGLCMLATICTIAISSEILIKRFNPRSYKGKTGKIAIKYKGNAQLNAFNNSDGKISQYSTSNGVLIVPVGKYEVWGCEAIAKDKNGVEWSASMSPNKALMVNISENKTQQLDFGPPFVAYVNVTKKGNKANMDLKLTTVQGKNTCVIMKTRGETTPPKFQAIDKSGKVVWSGSFKYG